MQSIFLRRLDERSWMVTLIIVKGTLSKQALLLSFSVNYLVSCKSDLEEDDSILYFVAFLMRAITRIFL
jgi:hypothetical protein